MIGLSQLVIEYFGDDGVPTSAVEWEDMDQAFLSAQLAARPLSISLPANFALSAQE